MDPVRRFDRQKSSLLPRLAIPAFLFALFGSVGTAAGAMSRPAPAVTEQLCRANPGLFVVSRSPAEPVSALAQIVEGSGLSPQRTDLVISGACTKFVVDATSDIMLADGTRLRPSENPPTLKLVEGAGSTSATERLTDPAASIATVSLDGKSPGALRLAISYYLSPGRRIALWSDGRQSLLAMVRCAADNAPAKCSIDHIVLRSRYHIAGLLYQPSPHTAGVGSIRLWYRLPYNEIVVTSADLAARY